MVEDKQNYYHPMPASVKAHLACHSALYVNGIVGRDSRELCQLDPFVVVYDRIYLRALATHVGVRDVAIPYYSVSSLKITL